MTGIPDNISEAPSILVYGCFGFVTMQVSAGTNNARVASQLRQLSSYYYKEPSLLFLLRVAQVFDHHRGCCDPQG